MPEIISDFLTNKRLFRINNMQFKGLLEYILVKKIIFLASQADSKEKRKAVPKNGLFVSQMEFLNKPHPIYS